MQHWNWKLIGVGAGIAAAAAIAGRVTIAARPTAQRRNRPRSGFFGLGERRVFPPVSAVEQPAGAASQSA